MKTARQRAASRRNLVIARSKRRRRVAVGVLAVAGGAAAVYGGTKIKGHPINVKNYTPPRAVKTVRASTGSHRVRSTAFKKANYPHTPEAKRAAARRYKHTNVAYRGISEAEVIRRTNTYESIRGKRVSGKERNSVLGKYRKQAV